MTALLLVLVGSLTACGSRDGREVHAWQPWNLVVVNYDHHHDVTVTIDGEDVGDVGAGRLAYYWVKPGQHRARIESEDDRVLDLGLVTFTTVRAMNVSYYDFYGTPPPPPPPEPADDAWSGGDEED